MAVDASTTLGDLVTADPRRSRVMERFGIDYCCNGSRSLAEASADAGIELSTLAAALEIPDPPPVAPSQHLENAALAHEIVDTHHAYLWEEMPPLLALVEKVAGVHGDRHAELEQVRVTYTSVIEEIEPHLTREERVAFPAISRLERTQAPVTLRDGTDLADLLAELVAEHDIVGDLFREIRSLTKGYAVPEDACGSYRAMLSGLEEMERDLHEHIHKENNILFPRVLELARRLAR